MPRAVPPLPWRIILLLLLLAWALGWLYRTSELAKRPMHTDEAILGVKTIELFETGRFQYDPHDYHGPLLHRSTLWLGRLLGWNGDLLSEHRLRLVSALYGIGCILVILLLGDALTRSGVVVSSFLVATSPMMTFYSRYYIMESALVFFSALFIASLWRWSQSRNLLWLVVAGVSLGAMHAAKETCILSLAAMAAGYVAARILAGGFSARSGAYTFSERRRGPSPIAWFIVPAIAALTSAALYSNFFRDWDLVRDSVLTYKSYLNRSAGSGHEKPWNYYLALLFWKHNSLCYWTEALIGGLGLAGLVAAIVDKRAPRHQRALLIFLGVYAVVLLVIYSVIPYKTPWSILSVDHAFAMLGGAGAAAIFRLLTWTPFKLAFAAALSAGVYNLCLQTSLAIDFNKEPVAKYSVHDLNPYVYSHTSSRVPELADRVHRFASLHPERRAMPIVVIQTEWGWPLKWYFRDLRHVGYYSRLPEDFSPPAVIIADAALQEEILSIFAPKAAPIVEPDPDFIGPLPQPRPPEPVIIFEPDEPCSLRPGVLLCVLVERNLRRELRRDAPAPR